MNKLIVTLASWLLLHTAAFALTVSPITIPLMPSQRSANLTIINDQGNEAITIRLLSRTWGQKPGEAETLEATDQLLAYPPQAVIAAGKSQTFRLLLRGNSSAARYFRVLVQTVAKPSTDPNTVSIGQGFSVPVFVEPAGAAPKLQARRAGKAIEVQNLGGAYELVTGLRAAEHEGRFQYLLPGARVLMPLPPQNAAKWVLETRRSGDVPLE